MSPEQGVVQLKRHEIRAQPAAADAPALELLAGAVAGAVGVWAMDRVDWFNYRLEDPRSRLQTQWARPGGEDPAHVLARIVERAAGVGLPPAEHHAAGMAIHYAIGIAPAALYGLLRGRMPALCVGRGTLYGLALFLIQDELINTVTGLAGDPRKYPWQAHARGLVAHLVYGVVTDTVLRAFDRRRQRRRAQPMQPQSAASANAGLAG